MFEEKNNSVGMAQAKNAVAGIPVYTMKGDLSSNQKSSQKSEEEITFTKTTSPVSPKKNISEKKPVPKNLPVSNSPFLTRMGSQEYSSPAKPPIEKKPVPQAPPHAVVAPAPAPPPPLPRKAPASNSGAVKLPNIVSSNPANNRKLLEENQLVVKGDLPARKKKGGRPFLLLIMLLLVAAAGAFYMYAFYPEYLSNLPISIPGIEKEIMPTETTPVPIVENPSRAPFSANTANYLRLDWKNATNESIKAEINMLGEKIIEENMQVPVEFLVTDEKNNPVSFSQFSQKIGINMPLAAANSLDDPFSLFIFNEKGEVKTGLAIFIKGDDSLSNILLKEEKSLPSAIAPLFLVSTYTIPDGVAFNNSSYQNVSIRYMNIISPEELSVDYAVYQDEMLVIGTTKTTLRGILDKLIVEDAKISE